MPQGYRIECSSDPSDPNPIRVTTPRGTTSRPDGEPTIPYDSRWHQQSAEGYPGYIGGPGPMQGGEPNGMVNGANGIGNSMSQLHAAANGNRALGPTESRRPGDPVEFNHAISYVNKIKTRFASQPDIYKRFLEILQTYQREQLRIAEVYTQVTQLFQDAPDLLDDFKQFLPDMAQQRPLDMMPNDNIRLPPVGNFAPPTPLGNTGSQGSTNIPPPTAVPPMVNVNPQSHMGMQPHPGSRTKKKGLQDTPVYSGQYDNSNIAVSNLRGGPKKSKDGLVSPTLVPATPEPLLPEKPGALLEEISFFDKAKKYISNKQTYNEFLKILNLFSQRIIDKNILVERVDGFLGGNKELMTWFKAFVKYEGKPLHIENIPYKKHLLELSLCRSYGRSYRLLPKSETYMPCSGRDEMCWEVLNDEWVGHPTWASEEAGFVAHRKNQYEEIMHRCEEERHEYDYYMEANVRSIQTLETITSRIANMTSEEKVLFKLPPNLGHTSTIYEKVLKKIYGEGRYHEVVDALRESPAVSVPIVLRRLKQKDEEWRRAHREWNKVWRDTEQKVFYKSLDHRGLTFKQTDKKYLTTRQLVSEIMTVKSEQNNKRLNQLTPKPKDQLLYQVKDTSVIKDLYRLVMCFLYHSSSYSTNDRERMEPFFKTFLSLFFSLQEDLISENVTEKEQEPQENTEVSSEGSTNGTKRPRDSQELLRDVLKKSKHAKLGKFREDSHDEDVEEEKKTKEEEDLEEIEKAGELWLKHITANSSGDIFEERPRHTFNLFANSTVYVFFRLINILYERLEEVKNFESIVSNEIGHSRKVQFAIDLELYDRRVEEMGLSFDKDDCYGQLLKLVEKLIEGDLDHQWYEEAIRQAYRNRAYKLYTVDKVLQAIVKHLHSIVSDVKSSDVLVLFEHDRTRPNSSAKEQILYRMKVSSVLGPDENMFRIEWDDQKKQALIQFLGNDDVTLKQMQTDEEKWNYYLTSYLMTSPTEGVPVDKVQLPFMHRNLPEDVEQEDFIGAIDQGLTARVCDSTYKLFFESNSEDFFSRRVGATAESASKAAQEQQQARWQEFLDGHHGWQANLSDDSLIEAQGRFDAWKNDGPDAMTAWQPPVKEIVQEDSVMADAVENAEESEANPVEAAEAAFEPLDAKSAEPKEAEVAEEKPAEPSEPVVKTEPSQPEAHNEPEVAVPTAAADVVVEEAAVPQTEVTEGTAGNVEKKEEPEASTITAATVAETADKQELSSEKANTEEDNTSEDATKKVDADGDVEMSG